MWQYFYKKFSTFHRGPANSLFLCVKGISLIWCDHIDWSAQGHTLNKQELDGWRRKSDKEREGRWARHRVRVMNGEWNLKLETEKESGQISQKKQNHTIKVQSQPSECLKTSRFFQKGYLRSVRKKESVDINSPCMRKVLCSWSVATGLISVRRLTYRPTTRGALLNPKTLQREGVVGDDEWDML